MNDNWKVKKVERLGSDYRFTVGPNSETDPEVVLAITVTAILTAVTIYLLGLLGIGFSWWLGLGILLTWLVLHVCFMPVTVILACVSIVMSLIVLFVFS